MAEVMNQLWKGETLKAEIKFAPDKIYTVYNRPDLSPEGAFIKEIKFRFSEGNNKVNPLGVATSNTAALQIYDPLDRLSPINDKSPYFGYIVNGIEIDLSIAYDGTNFEPYGTYYTTSWSGSFSEGWHGLVAINTEDILNTVGNSPLPAVEVFNNKKVEDIVAFVLSQLKIGGLQFSIDDSLNQVIPYFVVNGSKVRDFLNNLCQYLLARVVVDRSGVLNFLPALGFMPNYKTITFDGELSATGTLSNKNTNNINYNNIRVKYLEAGDILREQLFSVQNQDLIVGENTLSDIALRYQAISYEVLYLSYDNTDKEPDIKELDFEGSQQGVIVKAEVTGGGITGANIKASGLIVSTTEKEVNQAIPNTSIVGGTTFEFNTRQMMIEAVAKLIAQALVTYIQTISRVVDMKNTPLTPELYTGDQLIIKNTGTIYDGVYKITDIDLTFSESYNMSLSLVRLGVFS